jgi:hypothetical protein
MANRCVISHQYDVSQEDYTAEAQVGYPGRVQQMAAGMGDSPGPSC